MHPSIAKRRSPHLFRICNCTGAQKLNSCTKTFSVQIRTRLNRYITNVSKTRRLSTRFRCRRHKGKVKLLTQTDRIRIQSLILMDVPRTPLLSRSQTSCPTCNIQRPVQLFLTMLLSPRRITPTVRILKTPLVIHRLQTISEHVLTHQLSSKLKCIHELLS